MTDVVWASLIGAGAGVAAALIQASISRRRSPGRRTTDAIALVDASGKVVGNLTEEIDRLEEAMDEARAEAQGARSEARNCRDEVERLTRRVKILEQALRAVGIDPETVGS